jgi:prepilin-type N-terminal cleavage/methylation domain-containing protein
MQHRQGRCRGLTLFEVMITIALIALISGGIALAVWKHGETGKEKSTRIQATTVREGVKLSRAESASTDCPSFDKLMADGALDENSPRSDPWGNAWRISCDGSKVTVATNGPDRQAGTEDDIQVPRP